MKTKVKFITAWFGSHYMNYFDKWVTSLQRNAEFDFLVVGNIKPNIKLPKNVEYMHMDLMEFKKRLSNLVGFQVKISSLGKVAEYRPAFGQMFQRELQGYDYWGYIETDLILGKLSTFITDEVLSHYDQLFTLGHFILFKNDSEVSKLYKASHQLKNVATYRDAFRSNAFHRFDDGGISSIVKSFGKFKVLEWPEIIADIDFRVFPFKMINDENPRIFAYVDGHLVGYHCKNGELSDKKEFLYIHLQKRRMESVTRDTNFVIVPNKFLPLKSLTDKDMIKKSQRTPLEWKAPKNQIRLLNNFNFSNIIWF
ncbi:DUF6625 family protein, partial [Oenococcus oeni]